MTKWIKKIWNKWVAFFDFPDLNHRESPYMGRKWNGPTQNCPMCNFKYLEYDRNGIVGCPSCGWNPNEEVK